jgi:hypothetical protein
MKAPLFDSNEGQNRMKQQSAKKEQRDEAERKKS